MQRQPSGVVNCVIVGDAGIGKQFLLMADSKGRSTGSNFLNVDPDPLQTTIRYRGQQYRLAIFERAANGKRAQKTRAAIYGRADVALICFSTHDMSTFKNVIAKWIPELHRSSPSTPVVLIGMSQAVSSGTIQRLVPCSSIPAESESSISFDRCVQLACEIKAKAYLECDGCRKKILQNVFEEAILATLGPAKLKPQLKLNCFCLS